MRFLAFVNAAMAPLLWVGCGDAVSKSEPTPIRLDAAQRRAVIQKMSNKETVFILGESIEQSFDRDLRFTMDIEAAGANRDAEFTTTIDFFSLDMESDLVGENPAGRMDPTTMAIRPISEILRAATDLSYSGTLAPDGSVYALTGLDELRAEVHEKLKTRRLPAEFTGTSFMEDTVNELFGDEAIEITLEDILLPRPLDPLTVGTSWPGTTKINFLVTDMPADVRFTFESVAPEQIVVGEAVTFAIDSDGVQALREALSPNSPFDASVNGTGKGTYRLDPASGWVVQYDQTLSLSGKYDFNGGILTFNNYITRSFETYAE